MYLLPINFQSKMLTQNTKQQKSAINFEGQNGKKVVKKIIKKGIQDENALITMLNHYGFTTSEGNMIPAMYVEEILDAAARIIKNESRQKKHFKDMVDVLECKLDAIW